MDIVSSPVHKKPYPPFSITDADTMISRTRILVIICLLALCAIPVYTSAGVMLVGFPLKPSPTEGPYQDNEFMAKANATIYGLSNGTVPNGTALLEVTSTQQQLSKMKISPEFYPVASTINDFLFYTSKAGREYSQAMSLTSSIFSPVSGDSSQFNDANEYYAAAQAAWAQIKHLYPDVTLYTMSGGGGTLHDISSESGYSGTLGFAAAS
jgi:hypothetical protein